MMRGMFAAISGLKTHQVMLDVTANDIANVNTLGYKSARTTFKDSLTQVQRGGSAATAGNGGSNAAQIGLGTQVGSIDNLMQSGALQSTGNPLDVAIQGDGFFRIGQPGGTPAAPTVPENFQYSRAGNFTRNEQGYLVTQEGYYVVGRNPAGADSLINIPPTATDVAIGPNGDVNYKVNGAAAAPNYLSLATFPNSSGLERASGNRWQSSSSSGVERAGTPAEIGTKTTAGTIEMSNVDLAQAFTTMITAQRGFQANSRIISTSDEMLQDLVNLKR